MKTRCEMKENELHLFCEEAEVCTVIEELQDNQVILHMNGALRSDILCFIEDELHALVMTNLSIVMDLREVSYLSVSMQQIFLQIQQKIDEKGAGSFTLIHSNEKIMREFEQTGLTDLLMIEP